MPKKSGGIVSEYPNIFQGAAGDIRYCQEIGGSVLELNGPQDSIEMTCLVGDTDVKVARQINNTPTYKSMCVLALGREVVVTVGPNTTNTIPACHIPQK